MKLSQKTVARLNNPKFIQTIEQIVGLRMNNVCWHEIDQELFDADYEHTHHGPSPMSYKLIRSTAGRIVATCL